MRRLVTALTLWCAVAGAQAQEVTESDVTAHADILGTIDDMAGQEPVGNLSASPELSGMAEDMASVPTQMGREAAITTLQGMLDSVRRVVTLGYTCELHSQELIGGEMTDKRVRMWVRFEPRAVRVEFIEPDEGQLAVWQEGWESLRLNPPGLIPTISLDPNGTRAMATSHRPITEVGLDKTVERFISLVRACEDGAAVEVKHVGVEFLEGRELDRYDFLVQPVAESPIASFSVWVDPELEIPISSETRLEDGSVYERYVTTEFEVNPGFDEGLFDL